MPNRKWHRQITYDPSGVGSFFNFVFYQHVTPLGSLILGCANGCYKHVTPLGSLILGCTHGCYNYATLRCRARYNNLMESIDKPALHVARPWKGRMLVENAYDKYILTPEGSYVNWK